MVKKYVYGVYPTVVEAEDAVAHVINQGVPRDSVAIVGSQAHAYNGEAEFISYGELLDEQHEDNRGFFAKLFGWDDDDNDEEFENVDLTQYEDSLSRDELLVLVDQEFESQLPAFNTTETREVRTDDYVSDTTPTDTVNTETAAFSGAVGTSAGLSEDTSETIDGDATYVAGTTENTEQDYDYDDVNVEDNDYDPHIVGEETHIEAHGEPVGEFAPDADTETDTETERIRLHEEQVHADVRKKDIGDVSITKEVVEDTETIEVPVEREEIHIRHSTPTDTPDNVADGDAFQEEEIVIPVSEEEVVVDKETVVTDEVEVEKTTHTDRETVTETTRHEELEVDDETGRVNDETDRFKDEDTRL